MNYLQRLIQEVRIILFITLLLNNILLLGVWYISKEIFHLPFSAIVTVLLFASIILNFILAGSIGAFIMQPLKLIWRNILRVSPSAHGETPFPKLTTIWLGRDLVEALTDQVHQLVMVAYNIEQTNANAEPDLHHNFIANSLPLPLIILDNNETILFANMAALKYFGTEENELVNKNLQHRLNMTFSQTEVNFDSWLANAKEDSVTANRTWDDVRLPQAEGEEPLHFDLAAFYNKDNPLSCETILVFFDHTEKYSHTDQEVGLIAMAAHELRTPITMLRGYIEALDEDLGGELTPETEGYFNKLKVSSQQLSTFINNILNVARLEGNQLEVRLQEEDWQAIVEEIVESLRLRAEVRGLQIDCDIEEGLPTVGVDRFGITEVITNLIDNAIKYSAGKGMNIVIHSHLTKDGFIETSVEDQGVGIAESVVPTLFKKFQRNFHNRASISGTGLGLYLSKEIVNLHGGNIWVSSKEGEGTIMSFTLLPYDTLSDEQKAGQSNEIIKGNHGWIKNHHMSRR